MKIKCDYCGAFINDYDHFCQNCGAKNQHLIPRNSEEPLTIEELDIWFKNQNYHSPNQTKVFIGENYNGPNSFGIYKDSQTQNCIVYRTLRDGTKEIRYEGQDEAYAVNELYMKLKEMIVLKR
jgi:hypothetical protein